MKDTPVTVKPSEAIYNITFDKGLPTERVEEFFDEHVALSILLLKEELIVGGLAWPKDKEVEEKFWGVWVYCGDTFAYACSDYELLPNSELRTLYDMWLKDPENGTRVWCCQRRNQMPIPSVIKEIQDKGIWNLEGMNLKPNTLARVVEKAMSEAICFTDPS